MAGRPTGWAFEEVKTGDPMAKAVLAALADDADHDGYCYPSQERLSRKTELSVSTVKRKLRFLEKYGVITVERKQIDRQKRRNFYLLSLTKRFDLTAVDQIEQEIPEKELSGGRVTPVENDGILSVGNTAHSRDIFVTGGGVTPVNLQSSPFSFDELDRGQSDTNNGFTGGRVTPITASQGSPVNHEVSTATTTDNSEVVIQGRIFADVNAQVEITMNQHWYFAEHIWIRLTQLNGVKPEFIENCRIAFCTHHEGAIKKQAEWQRKFSDWVIKDWRTRTPEESGETIGEKVSNKLTTLSDKSWAEA